jgi:hypothetical protein
MEGVRRRLFGAASDTNRQYINQLQEEQLRDIPAAIEHYNFDFVNGVPLPGEFVWEPVLEEQDLEPQLQDGQGG